MVVSNRNLIFQRSIFRGYVSFREGNDIHLWQAIAWSCFVSPGEIDSKELKVAMRALGFEPKKAAGLGQIFRMGFGVGFVGSSLGDPG